MPHLPVRLTVALAFVMVGLRWIVNTNPWSGPTIIRLAEGHGVHLNDWVSFVCWAAAAMLVWPNLAAVPVLPRFARRRAHHGSLVSAATTSVERRLAAEGSDRLH